MPALLPVTNVLKVQMIYTVGADFNAHNIHHFGFTSGPPLTADLNTFAAAVNSQYAAQLAPLAAAAVVLTSVVVTDLTSATAAQGSNAVSVPGSRTGQEMDASTCVVTSYSNPRRYRGGHARTYWPFGTYLDLQNAGTWTASFTGAVNTGVTAFFSHLIGTTYGTTTVNTHVNVNYFHKHQWVPNQYGEYKKIPTPVNPPGVDVLGPTTTRAVPGNQRRRLRPG